MIPAATAAFDRLAPSYDALVSGEAFLHQRRQTQAVFGRWIRPGVRVLEIGCGTGLDTEFLATQGARVIACDPSEAMLSRARRRAAAAGVGDRVGLLSCGLQELPQFLDALDNAQGFDAIVSNFGALNCVPSLSALGVIGCRHLRPGGVVIVGLIGRTCLWETLYFTARGDAANARRRRAPIVAVPVAGVDVPTFYHRTTDVHACLGEAFRLDAQIGIGVAVPPPYLEPRWQRVPAPLRRAAARIDRAAGSWPIVNRLGDHTLTCWLKSRVPHA
ncbi:MAG TPA: class I SAM-dependent methyltransferase [Vicinamibacterales bacterium]|nr:class I SAM-dependent methyltransferase [Vicinamibacterales bacterium]